MRQIYDLWMTARLHGKDPALALKKSAVDVLRTKKKYFLALDKNEACEEGDEKKYQPEVSRNCGFSLTGKKYITVFFSERGVVSRRQDVPGLIVAVISKNELLDICKSCRHDGNISVKLKTYFGEEIVFLPEELIKILSVKTDPDVWFRDIWYAGRFSQSQVTVHRLLILLLAVILIGISCIALKPSFKISEGVLEKYRGKENVVYVNENGPEVERIKFGAFEHKNNCIEELVFKDGLKKIDFGGISNCAYLRKITFPDTLRIIDSGGIRCCPELEELEIPVSVVYFGGNISGCPKLKKLTMGKTLYGMMKIHLEELGDSVELVLTDDSGTFKNKEDFYEITSYFDEQIMVLDYYPFDELTVPDGIVRLKQKAYFPMENLRELHLPDTLESLQGIFSSSGLEEIELPDSVCSLPLTCFENCKKLRRVVVGSGIERLPVNCFEGCTELKEVILSDGLKEIESDAFSGTAIEEITIPATVEELEAYAFSSCSSLERIYIMNPETKISNREIIGDKIVFLEMP